MVNNWPLWLLLSALLGLAVSFDIVSRRIPNWLVLAGLIAGVGYTLFAAQAGDAPVTWGQALAQSLLGAVTGLALLLPLYLLRAMGAGDAKLMAAIGAFLGPIQVVGAVVLTFIAGGLLSLIAALFSGSLTRVLGNLRLMGLVLVSSRASGLNLDDVQTTGRLPYSIAIAIGTGLQLWLAARGGWPFV